MKRRLLIDTPVFVAAYGDPRSPSEALLAHAAKGDFTLVCSRRLIEEVLRVVGKVYGTRQADALMATIQQVPSLRIVGVIEWERALPRLSSFARDPSDGPHFAAARAGGADALVSYNRRSIHEGMFDLVPLATPEAVLPAIRGISPWPSRDELREEWRRWAQSSARAPEEARRARRQKPGP